MIALLTKYGPMLIEGTLVTLYMTVVSTVFAYVLGLPMGVLLRVTDKGGIMEKPLFNSVFGWIVNIIRSFPFVILMVALIPFTRLVTGKMIGPNGAIVSLVVAAAPFVARLVESSLAEVDVGVIDAAKCMGATNFQIIRRVMLSESVPSLIRGFSLTTITLIGYSAMAGAVGAGGLGDIALRYGLYRSEPEVMNITVVLLIVLVCAVQLVFDLLAARLDKRNR